MGSLDTYPEGSLDENPPVTISAKGSLPATIVYTDQANTFGAFNQTFKDTNLKTVASGDATKVIAWLLSGMTTGITLTLSSAQSTAQTLNIPNITATDTLVTLLLAQVLKNKKLDATNTFVDTSDNTKVVSTSQTGMTTGVTLTESYSQSTSQTLNFPNITATDTLVTLLLAQVLKNKKIDATNSFVDTADNTKVVASNQTGMTTGVTLTESYSQSTSQTLNFPNITATDTLSTLGLAQTWTALQTLNNSLAFGATGSVISKYKNINTAGVGVSPIYGATSQKAETQAADANVLTYTPPATAGSYRVRVVASVSSATSGIISFTLDWKDSNGNAQSAKAIPLFQIGTAAPNTTFTTSAAGNYSGGMEFDIDASATNIVVKWVGGGTTAAKVTATIEQVA